MQDRDYHDIQTADDAMGIFGNGSGTKRVNNLNRDDVTNHITACETWGYLSPEQATRRREAAEKAQTASQLFHLVSDLPSEGTLGALGARKRLSAMNTRAGKLSRWLVSTKLGRAVFHGLIAAVSLMTAIIPITTIDNVTHGHFYLAGIIVTVTTLLAGLIAFVANGLFCIDWFIDNG